MEVMDAYKSLQRQIGELSADYDQEEEALVQELSALDKQNMDSLRAYRDVSRQALSAKEALTKIVEEINNAVAMEQPKMGVSDD